MKDVLIVFGILLLILILISTFGGSIRYREKFEDAIVAPQMPSVSPPSSIEAQPPLMPVQMEAQPESEVVEGFDGGAYAGFQGENDDVDGDDDAAEQHEE